MSSKKTRLHRHPVFIAKLQQMVQDSSISDIFGWTPSGDSFQIKNVTQFILQVLPKYFTHKNFSSFVRQLNLYGFRKIPHQQGQNVYMNEHFKAGSRHQLRYINRKYIEGRQSKRQGSNESGRQRSYEEQVNELVAQQKNLEQMCHDMVRQNQKIKQKYQNTMLQYEYGYRVIEKRMEDFVMMLLEHKTGENKGKIKGNRLKIESRQKGQICGNEKVSIIEVMSRNLKNSKDYARVKKIKDAIYAKLDAKNRRDATAATNFSHHDRVSDRKTGLKGQLNKQGDIEEGDDSYLSFNSFLDLQRSEQHVDSGQQG